MYVMLLISACLVTDTPESVEPLTSDQVARIQTMLSRTRHRDAELKQQLQRQQGELISAYGDFQLNRRRVERLQEEVLAIQRELLGNYHRMQVELRTIVGPQRFAMLKRRIDFALQSRSKQQTKDVPRSGSRHAPGVSRAAESAESSAVPRSADERP